MTVRKRSRETVWTDSSAKAFVDEMTSFIAAFPGLHCTISWHAMRFMTRASLRLGLSPHQPKSPLFAACIVLARMMKDDRAPPHDPEDPPPYRPETRVVNTFTTWTISKAWQLQHQEVKRSLKELTLILDFKLHQQCPHDVALQLLFPDHLPFVFPDEDKQLQLVSVGKAVDMIILKSLSNTTCLIMTGEEVGEAASIALRRGLKSIM